MEEQKSKYMKIVDWIKEKIENNELTAGAKMYSEHELVSIFQMSRQTVRRAISVLEQERLVERRRGSGTYIKDVPKQEVNKKRIMRVAIVTTYMDEYIFPGILKELERRLSEAGYNIQIAFTHNSLEKEKVILNELMADDTIDGMIAETTKSGLPNPNLQLYRQLEERGTRIVFLNSCYPELPLGHVSLNDEKAGQMATEHLICHGHERIGAIFKSDDGQGHRRYLGYINALLDAGIAVEDERIIWLDTVDLRYIEAQEERILRRLWGCTACVCYNDEVADKLIGIAKAKGLSLPAELSVTGIDNSELAEHCEVPFTSVGCSAKQLAGAAAVMLLELLNGDVVTNSMELEPVLTSRNSVVFCK